MSDSYLVGFQCQCGRRTAYVRADMMALWAKPGETIHGVRMRLKCRECKALGPNGPYPIKDSDDHRRWIDTDIKVLPRLRQPEEE